jgi:hypothetical protein
MWRTAREYIPKLFWGWAGLLFGVAAGAIGIMLQWLLPNGLPAWGWWLLVILALVGANFRAYHDVRKERDSYRPDPAEQGKWPIYDAVQYLLEKSGWKIDKSKDDKMDSVLTEIREAAAIGYIHVWGRNVESQHFFSRRPPERIAKEYWSDHAFDEPCCLSADSDGGRTQPETRAASELTYEDVRLVKTQVKFHWPPLTVWKRCSVRLEKAAEAFHSAP